MDKENLHYIIDFTNVETYWDMHFTIRDSLDFPDYYGCNWDAFWDCLTDMLGRPINIEIFGLDVIERKFGNNIAKELIDTFRELKYENDRYTDNIKITIVNGDISVEI